MDKFDKIGDDIKKVKIQGAENIAIAAANALLIRNDKKAIRKLLSLRPTEPCMYNTIKFITSLSNIEEGIKKALAHFSDAKNKISLIGSRLIKDDMLIFTHCHSTAVVDILLKAKEQGKNFSVNLTESRPLYQGRITARQLAKAKIPVTLFVDSAARIALKKADIILFGCDAMTTTKIYNKIGSEMFAIIANNYKIPVYIATDSWKFDARSIYGEETKLEKRPTEEIWENPPKGVKILNPAFEKIDSNLVTAIISELGFLLHKSFMEELRKKHNFIFKTG